MRFVTELWGPFGGASSEAATCRGREEGEHMSGGMERNDRVGTRPAPRQMCVKSS